MFKSQQYRAKAAEYDELAKSSTGLDESRKFEALQDRLTSLADNEQGLADDFDNAVLVAEQWDNEGGAVRDESPNEHPQEEKSDVTYTIWRR
jgi:hypothetical protein